MAFTPDQLLSFNDLVTLVNTEGYFVKNSFTPSTELVTKTQIMDALWLAGNPPLDTYAYNQHVRYEDISPLGTLWSGDTWECVFIPDVIPPVNEKPLPPTIIDTNITTSSITIDWTANPGSDDEGIIGYIIYYARTSNSIFTSVDVGNVTTYVMQGLLEEEEYLIYVRAYDIEPLESDNSNILTLTTLAPGGTPVFTDPYNLTRACSADGIISIAWAPATSDVGIKYHTVHYRTGTDAWSTVNISNVNNAVIDGLSIATYEVYVTATNEDNQVSGATSTVDIDAISLPSNLYYYEDATLPGYNYLWQHRGVRSGTELVLTAPNPTDTNSGINRCLWYTYPENDGNYTLTKTFYESEAIDGKGGNVGSGSEFWHWPFNFQICVVGESTGTIDNIMSPLTFIDTTTEAVTLSWQDPTSINGTVGHFEVEYKLSSSSTWLESDYSVDAALRQYQVTGLQSLQDYGFRVRFYTVGAEYSDWTYTAATTREVLGENCGDTQYSGSQGTSQIYDFNMTGSLTNFQVYFEPQSIPDRVQVLSGGVVLYDSLYRGSKDYYDRLASEEFNVAEEDLDNLGDIDEGTGTYGIREDIASSGIVGGTVRIIVDAPMGNTAWQLQVKCNP